MTDDISVKIGGDSGDAQKAISDVTQALKDGVGQMSGSINQLAEGFSQFKGILVGFSAVLAGGAIFKEAISSTVAFTGEISALSKKMGITKDEAGKLSVGLKLIGVSTDTYTGASSMLNRQLRTNEQALKNMGVVTRDANGNLKNQEQVMDSALAAMMQYKEGTDRNLAAQAMFGRGADEVTQLLKLNNDVKAEAARLQKAYNLEVGDEGVSQTKAYKMAMAEVSISLEAVMDAVGKDVLPLFVQLGDWFKGAGVDAVSGFISIIEQFGESFKLAGSIISDFWGFIKDTFNQIEAAIEDALVTNGGVKTMNVFTAAIRVLNTVLVGFKNGCAVIFETISMTIAILINDLKTLGNVAKAALSLDWDGIETAWKQGCDANEKIIQDSMNRIVDMSKKAADDMTAAILGEKAAGADPKKEEKEKKPAEGTKSFVEPKEKKGKADQDKRLQEWKNQLDRMKEAEGNYFKDSKEMEEAFWTEKLAQVQGSGEKEKAIRRAIEHELYNIHKAQAIQERSVDEEAINSKQKVGEANIEEKKEELKTKLALGQINDEQEIAGEKSLAEQQNEIEREALDAKIALYEQDALAVAKLQEQKLDLERKHAAEIQKINDALLIKQKQNIDQMLTPITNAISTSVQGIVQGTTTAAKALHNIFQSILAEFVNLCAQQLVKWAAKEIGMTSLTKSGSTIRSMLEKIGLIETEATAESTNAATAASTQASSDAQVVSTAPVVAAKAAGSVAGYPYVGPILAAAAFAAMMAMVLGSRGHAVGSWDVPGDMITKIHKGEMIVPQQFADNVRDNGGLGGGGAVHFHVNAVDAAGVSRMLKDNASSVSEVLRRQARNFSPSRT